jgi:Na+-transporting NADH:ubiquinone oxidoreductase subunit C
MINKQSNVYTIVYITLMVVIVGAALAITSMVLKDRQQENADADKMKQILQSVHVASDRSTVVDDYHRYIVNTFVINSLGQPVEGADAFNVDVAVEAKKPRQERLLPVYVCNLPDAGTKYILPLSGMGLWGPIWGYVSLDDDGSTVYGAFFGHQSETPGLGAEITKEAFTSQFPGKQMFKNGEFLPVTVVKKGQTPAGNEDYVDGISGGTITSKGVAAMLNECMRPYQTYLETLSK